MITIENIEQACEEMLTLADSLAVPAGETEAQRLWFRAYVTLCHLKVDLHRAIYATENPDVVWPEPPLKPPRTRFDAMPGEIDEKELIGEEE